MKFLGNLLWLLLGGFISGCLWIFEGFICCVTLVGIPFGLQCFKFAFLAFTPFGREIRYGGGTVSFLANLIWIVIGGIPMAAVNAVFGCILCVTIIGIPFGIQFFKLARLSLMPFGADVVHTGR